MTKKNGDKRWHEFIKLKEILVFTLATTTSVFGAVNWVDSRYANSKDVEEQEAILKEELVQLECRLSTIILGLSTTGLIEEKQKELDILLKKYVEMQLNQNPSVDDQVSFLKIEAEISDLRDFVSILKFEDLGETGDCK